MKARLVVSRFVAGIFFVCTNLSAKDFPSTGVDEEGVDLSEIWIRRYDYRYQNYAFTAEPPSMTPWATKRFEATRPAFGPRSVAVADTNDPVYECLPPGTPRIYAHPAPFEILQTPGRMMIVYEFQHLVRRVFTDGREHRQDRLATWMGESIGHWEGDTLMLETVNFNDKTWIDRRGVPHSDQLRVVERIRRTDGNELIIDITVEDPVAFTEPWTVRRVFDSVDWRLEESVCSVLANSSFEEFERTLLDYDGGSVEE